MRVGDKYSHLNGEEWLLVHAKDTYQLVLDVIQRIDAEKCRTKISKEKGMKGKRLYSPVALNKEFDEHLSSLGWQSSRYDYYIGYSHEQVEAMMNLPLEKQRQYLLDHGKEPIFSYKQTDHVKDRIAIEVQFGKYAFVAYDPFCQALAVLNGSNHQCRRRDTAYESNAT